MKVFIAFLLVLNCSAIDAQDLQNTRWIKIKVERKDGSRVMDRFKSEKGSLNYHFKDSTVSCLRNDQYLLEQKYSINGNTLSIGDYIRYNIDTINSERLVVTEIPKDKLPDDRINRFTFINSKFIFDYLRQTNQVIILGDSIIVCDNKFSPVCEKGKLDELLMAEFGPVRINNVFKGYILMSANGNIENVEVTGNDKFSNKETRQFISVIRSTNGAWSVPALGKPLRLKIDFICRFYYEKTSANIASSGISLIFHQTDPLFFMQPVLTMQQIKEADRHFNMEVKLFTGGQFAKAANAFTMCIENDSTYLDAYYNKAYCFQKLSDTKAACETWMLLKQMGQKPGEVLYNNNCK